MSKTVFKTTSKRPTPHFTVEYRADETIFKEGDLGTDMYIIHEGQVEIFRDTEGDTHSLAILEKGDFFGEMSLLDDLPRNASARAVSDVKLLQIDGSTFDQMLRNNPEVAVRMMRKFSRRLREMDKLLQRAVKESGEVSLVAEPEPTTDLDAGPERLVHNESGMEFHLASGEETTVGRQDPVTGIYPEIDLTPVDSQRSVSRRHAKIYRRGDKFFLSEEIGTMNGTFANGNRLNKGVPVEVKDGDELRFGVVNTIFRPA